jgi:hypothetical protein
VKTKDPRTPKQRVLARFRKARSYKDGTGRYAWIIRSGDGRIIGIGRDARRAWKTAAEGLDDHRVVYFQYGKL